VKLWRRKKKTDEIDVPIGEELLDELQDELSGVPDPDASAADDLHPLEDSTGEVEECQFAEGVLDDALDTGGGSGDVEWKSASAPAETFDEVDGPAATGESVTVAASDLVSSSFLDDPLEKDAPDATADETLAEADGTPVPHALDGEGAIGGLDVEASTIGLDGEGATGGLNGEEPVDGLDGEQAADELSDEEASGELEDEPKPAGKLDKVRSIARISVDTDKLRHMWRGSSVGRTALLAVIVYMLAVGSSFFFLMQPASTRLHEVKGQKDILHDYMVITQAGAAIGTFKDGLMTGDQRLTVMSEVTQMAEASGVRVIGDPELLLGRDAPGSFSEYPMRIRAKGTFHEIGGFLSLLESSPRYAIVEEVEIRSDVASRSSESEVTVLLALAAWEG
jgi:hypothetical protein